MRKAGGDLNAQEAAFNCLLGCNIKTNLNASPKVEESKAGTNSRDYSREPMHAIFAKHDRDKDGYLK